jgi:Na+-driven multidrug efflux pump
MLSIGIPALRIIAIHYAMAAFCIVFMAVFQALGNGVESLIVSVARQLIVLLPAAWLLSLTGRVNMVWWSFPIAECFSLAASSFFIKRIYDRKLRGL